MAINYVCRSAFSHREYFRLASRDAENWTESERAALAAIADDECESENFGSGRRYTAPDGTVFLGHDSVTGYNIGLIR